MKKLFCKLFGHNFKIKALPSLKHIHRHLVKVFVTKCNICDFRLKVEDEEGNVIYGKL